MKKELIPNVTTTLLQLKGNGLEGWGIAMAIAKTMRDKHYPNRTIRLSDEVWNGLKEKCNRSGLSWNLYLRKIAKIKVEPKKKIT